MLSSFSFFEVFMGLPSPKTPKTVKLFKVFVSAFCLRRFGTAVVRSQRNKRMLFLEPREESFHRGSPALKQAECSLFKCGSRKTKKQKKRSLNFIKEESTDKRVDQMVSDELITIMYVKPLTNVRIFQTVET